MTINLDNLSEEQRKKLMNLNSLQQSYEITMSQRLQIESALRDTELAIEELEKIKSEDTVYKAIGGILIKSEKDKLLDEKKSLKVTLEMKLKTYKQKEERVRNQIETMRKSFEADFQA